MFTRRPNTRGVIAPPSSASRYPPRGIPPTKKCTKTGCYLVVVFTLLVFTTFAPLIFFWDIPHPNDNSSHHGVHRLTRDGIMFHPGQQQQQQEEENEGKKKENVATPEPVNHQKWHLPNLHLHDIALKFQHAVISPDDQNLQVENSKSRKKKHGDALSRHKGGIDTIDESLSQDEQQQPQDDHIIHHHETTTIINPQHKFIRPTSLARGVSGLPLPATPSLMEAKRASIQCKDPDENVDFLAYWNNPQGYFDVDFQSPFLGEDINSVPTKYITFQPDAGGWNNIRMSLEIIFVMAHATGRTLVLPPDIPLYRLTEDKENRQRGFADFYPLYEDNFRAKVKVISMEEFLNKEAFNEGARFPIEDVDLKEAVKHAANKCENRAKSDIYCEPVWDYLSQVGYVPDVQAQKDCLIFDRDNFEGGIANFISDEKATRVREFCKDRTVHYYTTQMQEEPLIHIAAGNKDHRLLNHFYGFLYFTDPAVDNYFKRFVRDFLHYHDAIYCAAGKIVRSVQEEGMKRGFALDEEGGGGYSSLHIRRGDLQYKKVKISAEEWHEDIKDLWLPNEILYIATDEKNKTFFDPLKEHYTIKFLDDYWDMAGLANLDPNYMGMIDTIVASRGRKFVGTWFSTFTGYINRMRGYHGMSMKDSYYGTSDRKHVLHESGLWLLPSGNWNAREFSVGWVGIDGDDIVKGERDPHAKPTNATDVVVVADDTTSSLGREVSALPLSQTPALVGSQRGHIECDVNVDSLVYWNDPQGTRDITYKSPFDTRITSSTTITSLPKYITFEPDHGGWNNIRMSLENIFVIALITGRTVVLPPDQPLYLLNLDGDQKQRGFADFFPFQSTGFQDRVEVISTQQFLEREGTSDGQLPIPSSSVEALQKIQSECVRRDKSDNACKPLFEHYKNVGHVPDLSKDNCFIFDLGKFISTQLDLSEEDLERVQSFCNGRTPLYYNTDLADYTLLHFATSEKSHRILEHFYNFMYFTDPLLRNYARRFVRDFMHYNHDIFCAAGKIVLILQEEGEDLGFELDKEGGGAYSSLHVRRGDLQYKKVKIPAEEWYENTKDLWLPNEILYIATDERNKTFFDPLKEHYTLKFLDDYWEMAGLADLDPNYMGMIDTIVASRGRVFSGTWFSTFTGYINRLRGYEGMSMMDSYYGFLDKKYVMHSWAGDSGGTFAREYPGAWIGIDGDELPTGDKF